MYPSYMHNHVQGSQPSGGWAFGPGYTISWQETPNRSPSKRTDMPDGACVEDILDICILRLKFYQTTLTRCPENDCAITYLRCALTCLEDRHNRRAEEGTRGTANIVSERYPISKQGNSYVVSDTQMERTSHPVSTCIRAEEIQKMLIAGTRKIFDFCGPEDYDSSTC